MRRLASVFLEVLKRMNNARFKIALTLCFVLYFVAAILNAFRGNYEDTAAFLFISYLVMLGIIYYSNLKRER